MIRPGYKCNMPDIQAAIGVQQLKKIPGFQERRREIVERYNEAFADLDEIDLPVEKPEARSAWHLYAMRLNLGRLKIDRSRFIEELKDRNIGPAFILSPSTSSPITRINTTMHRRLPGRLC